MYHCALLVTLSLLPLLLIPAALTQECNPTYNQPPRGVNSACTDPKKPYCVDGVVPYCGSCNPRMLNWLCDCPAGQFCDADYAGPTYGNCTTNYPKAGQPCSSPSDCKTDFFIGNVNWGSIQLVCMGSGSCLECNPILNATPVTCTSGVLVGQDRYCTQSGVWASSTSSSGGSGGPSTGAAAATGTVLMAVISCIVVVLAAADALVV